MWACIHRGTREIGGTCVEVEAQGRRILLDLGLPLDASGDEAALLPIVPGLNEPDPTLLAVVLSTRSPGPLGPDSAGPARTCRS